MAPSKLLLCSFFLVISSLYCVGFAQKTPGASGAQLPCVQKLLPCQPYLKDPSNPPASCCIPLKELVANDKQCLCQVFTNPVLLKSLNITQQDAMQLSKACNANADPSDCKTAGVPPTASSPPPSTSNSSSKTNSTASGPSKNAAVGVGAPLGASAVTALLLFLVLSSMG
ncbi:non-specific lipid transfer protein GPI-anchored 9 [Coffea arabica]|uniref:Non-specific lipid transfer protein GPI-anchored 9 n=1 Tax=Coffea arabica TaxID=13443 RepID=A0A6P6XBL1_COFAR|nr:xylogen-like protein 11 isoform X1 [Coffea arabica]